jgi:two-component system KDP operon response regulator KdpE
MAHGRVIIVDDHPESLESLALLMEGWGHVVASAHTGSEALALLAAGRPPHVAIVDLALPDIPGCDVIRGMKAAIPGLFVIAHSGHNELRDEARLAGADAFVLKPNFEVLEGMVARHVEAARPRKRESNV